jgi:lipopolysaccharide transport system ATP-binding protein
MSEVAIRVENVSKRYRIGQNTGPYYVTLRDRIATAFTNPFRRLSSRAYRPGLTPDNERRATDEYIWALKGISFEVRQGEVIGIIGRNGAGKSTLLKILSRITEPTEGYAELHGRVRSLLEVGTGFHPELTGRENIYLNGAILGMRKAEITRKFDEIVAFAEVEKFVDTPVKHYSSGMYVRLAFAVAAHLEPEILIVDEVLAVGDAMFQKKCLGKMQDVASEGRTVLFVSHNMATIERLCDRCILLQEGQVSKIGIPTDVIHTYINTDQNQNLEWNRKGDFPPHAHVRRLTVCDEAGLPVKTVTSKSTVGIEIECFLPKHNPSLRLGLGILDAHGQVIFSTAPIDSESPYPTRGGLHLYRVMFPEAFFMPQRYSVTVVLYTPFMCVDQCDHKLVLDVVSAASLANFGDNSRPGVVQVKCKWQYQFIEVSENNKE